MSEASNSPKLSLNVMINKQKSKVLFAEANSHVTDVLLSFLTLPLGKIVRILEKHYGNEAPVIGSITTLHGGLTNLDSTHFCVGGAKQMLLNPRNSFEIECHRLKLDVPESQPKKYFVCRKWDYLSHYSARIMNCYSDIDQCDCGKILNVEIPTEYVNLAGDDGNGGFLTANEASFIICDDLRIVPVVTGFLQTLNSLGITDADSAELVSFSFEIDDVMDLLKYSLISATPLTDLVIKNSRASSTKPEPGILLHRIGKETVSNNSKEMILKVSIQKSNNKFLFAQATGEFVDFLFSLLTIPLGGVECLFGGNTSLKNIDNLCKSVRDVIDHEYFKTPDYKNRLIDLKQPHGCSSKNQFLPLSEDSPPPFRQYSALQWNNERCETYIKKKRIFIVSDDLTVTPFSVASSVSMLNGLGIPFSDVKETELSIGLEEALCILKVSLTSTISLTDALIKPALEKQPKREHQPKRPIQLVGQIV